MVEIPMRRHEEGGQPASSNELELGDSIASEGSPNPRALEHEHAEGSEDGPLNDSLNKGNANPPPVASADPFVRTRKPKSKKPKAMPRRPLSAYNYFFRAERERLMQERERDANVLGESEVQGSGGVRSSNVLFASIGKMIAKRWKELSDEDRKRYQESASMDMNRYRQAMNEYHFKIARERLQKQQQGKEGGHHDDFDDEDDDGSNGLAPVSPPNQARPRPSKRSASEHGTQGEEETSLEGHIQRARMEAAAQIQASGVQGMPGRAIAGLPSGQPRFNFDQPVLGPQEIRAALGMGQLQSGGSGAEAQLLLILHHQQQQRRRDLAVQQAYLSQMGLLQTSQYGAAAHSYYPPVPSAVPPPNTWPFAAEQYPNDLYAGKLFAGPRTSVPPPPGGNSTREQADRWQPDHDALSGVSMPYDARPYDSKLLAPTVLVPPQPPTVSYPQSQKVYRLNPTEDEDSPGFR